MPIVYLVGLHGSGKTTAGQKLTQAIDGHVHISVGDLARFGRRGTLPAEVPTRLMACLARHQPGTVFSFQTATLLSDYLKTLATIKKSVSVDGFPSSPEHIQLLPNNAVILHLSTSEQTRHSRLENRSLTTGRKWVNGGASERDTELKNVLVAASIARVKVIDIDNSEGADELRQRCLKAFEKIEKRP
jgi:adenylate kinase family enzyme